MLRKATINLSQKNKICHPSNGHSSLTNNDTTPFTTLGYTKMVPRFPSVSHCLRYKQTHASLTSPISSNRDQYTSVLNNNTNKQKSSLHAGKVERINRSVGVRWNSNLSNTFNYSNLYYLSLQHQRQQFQIKRLFSTNNDKNGAKKAAKFESITNSNKAKNAENDNIKSNGFGETLFNTPGRTRLFIGLGVATAGVIALPIITRQLDFTPKQEYQEADVEEELYDQMKDVSNDLDGELAKHVLPGQLSHQLAEGGKTKAVDNTVNLVKDVISSDALQSGLTTLLARVVGSNQFQNACQMLLKNLWDDLISDPETIAQVVALLNTAIKDEKIKSSFRQLILGLLQDEEVKRELTGLVVKLGEEKEILDATRDLLAESAHRALNDPEILDHSMEFATDVVGDNVLQRTSGEALRNTVTYAVKPSLSAFLSVFGLALLFFSVSALGNARVSAKQGREIDAAASIVAKTIGDSIVSAISKIVSLPLKAVSGLTSAIVATILYPFKLVGTMIGAVGHIGNDVVAALVDLVTMTTSFPSFVQGLISLSVSALSKILDKSYFWITSAPEKIIEQTKLLFVSLGVSIWQRSSSFGNSFISSLMSFIALTGTKLTNLSNVAVAKSHSKLDKVGNDILIAWSHLLANILALFKGSTKGESS